MRSRRASESSSACCSRIPPRSPRAAGAEELLERELCLEAAADFPAGRALAGRQWAARCRRPTELQRRKPPNGGGTTPRRRRCFRFARRSRALHTSRGASVTVTLAKPSRCSLAAGTSQCVLFRSSASLSEHRGTRVGRPARLYASRCSVHAVAPQTASSYGFTVHVGPRRTSAHRRRPSAARVRVDRAPQWASATPPRRRRRRRGPRMAVLVHDRPVKRYTGPPRLKRGAWRARGRVAHDVLEREAAARRRSARNGCAARGQEVDVAA